MADRLIKEPNKIQAVLFGYLIKNYNKVQTSKMNKFIKELNLDRINVKGLKDFSQTIDNNEELSELVQEAVDGDVGLGQLVKYGTKDKTPLADLDPLDVVTAHVTNHYRNLRNNRAFNKQRREGSYYKILMEDLQEHLSEEIKDLGVSTIPTREDNFEAKLKGSSLIVTLSDTHVGAVVNNHPEIGVGYNYSILLERLGDYIDEIKSFVSLFDVDNIRVYFVGDAIENANMRSDQSFHSEFDTSEQISKSIRALFDFLSEVEKLKPVKFGMVNGNHDRLSGARNKKDKIYNDSAAYVILDSLIFFQEQGLLHNVDIIDNRVAMHVFFDEVMSKKVVVTHGDHLKKGDKFKQIQTDRADLGFSGHFHSFEIQQENEEQLWVQVSSIMGSNTYSAENNFTRTSPSQTLVVLNEDLEGPLVYNVFL